MEVERICATRGGPERADVEKPDCHGGQDEEGVEKMQAVLGCPHTISKSGGESGLARSGRLEIAWPPHVESKKDRADAVGREQDEP